MLQFFKKLFPQKIKNFYHLLQAVVANVVFGFPGRKVKIIGVTGTNGKTTTCQMIVKILEEAGRKVALASTINFKLGEKEWTNKTKFTTLSAWAVQKFIAQAVRENCQYLVLETSSHSLDQYRVWGVNYAVAVLTNITREHLDYHQTMEEYRDAKLKLFEKAKMAIVNLKADWAGDFLKRGAGEKWGYFIKNQNGKISALGGPASGGKMENYGKDFKILKAENLELGKDFSKFSIEGVEFESQLLGEFNIENALAAVGAGLSQGIDLETSAKALAKIEKVPGRIDQVKNDLGIKIIIDYALTPDSMEKLGALAQSLKEEKGKIIWVFGACGERDRGKRPMMGAIGARLADLVIITNEDPYFEDAGEIIEEVFAGVTEGGKVENENCWKILDRREAIAKALNLAKEGDLILVTGKGAEETMAVGAERIPWNDRKVIEEEVEKYKVK